MSVVIIGIMGGVVTMGFHRSVSRSRIVAARDRLANDLYLVRAQAIAEQKERELTFNLAGCRYEAENVPDINKPRDLAVDLGNSQYGVTRIKLNGEEKAMMAGKPKIRFAADGTCLDPKTISLECRDIKLTLMVNSEGVVTFND